MKARATAPAGHRPREGRKGVAGETCHGLESLGADAFAAEMFGEGDDPKLQRRPVAKLQRRSRLGWRAREPYEFGRTAADIEQQHAFGITVDQSAAAARGKARFCLAVDDFQLEAGLVQHPGDEFRRHFRRRGRLASRRGARA